MKELKYPENIAFAVGRLEAAGYGAYVVGGALRNLLLGRPVHDWDLTTPALPDEMQRIFADCRTVTSGLKHGTLTVILGGEAVEITTFRIDGEYRDSRHPESVRFTDRIADDLARRDFTVNAMAYSERTGLIDLFGGREDLAAGVIRAVGVPEKRFREDALRILRAFRFSSVLGFSVEPETFRAIGICRQGLSEISAERITAELVGILTGDGVVSAMEHMRESGVLSLILPEAVFDGRLARLPSVFEVRLAFCLRGVPRDVLSARLGALKLSNASASKVARLVTLTEVDISDCTEPRVRRLMAQAGTLFEPLLALFEALGRDVTGLSAVAERCRARHDCLTTAELAVNGSDLIAVGISGRDIGSTLARLTELVLDDPTLNRKDILLALAKKRV